MTRSRARAPGLQELGVCRVQAPRGRAGCCHPPRASGAASSCTVACTLSPALPGARPLPSSKGAEAWWPQRAPPASDSNVLAGAGVRGRATHLSVDTADLALAQEVCAATRQRGVHSATVHLDYLDTHRARVTSRGPREDGAGRRLTRHPHSMPPQHEMRQERPQTPPPSTKRTRTLTLVLSESPEGKGRKTGFLAKQGPPGAGLTLRAGAALCTAGGRQHPTSAHWTPSVPWGRTPISNRYGDRKGKKAHQNEVSEHGKFLFAQTERPPCPECGAHGAHGGCTQKGTALQRPALRMVPRRRPLLTCFHYGNPRTAPRGPRHTGPRPGPGAPLPEPPRTALSSATPATFWPAHLAVPSLAASHEGRPPSLGRARGHRAPVRSPRPLVLVPFPFHPQALHRKGAVVG